MRRNLSLVIFLFGFIYAPWSFAQINNAQKKYCLDSLIHLRGYFVRIYKKSDIKEQERNRIDKMNNKPFRIRIDGNTYDEFFLPIRDTNILDLADALPKLPIRDKKEIYLRCTSANYTIFKEHFCIDDERVKTDTCKRFTSSKYYSLKTTSKYCYQIFYVSGTWLKATAEANTQKSIFAKQTKYIDPLIKKFNIYLLYNVDDYIPNDIKQQRFSLWKDVPPVME